MTAPITPDWLKEQLLRQLREADVRGIVANRSQAVMGPMGPTGASPSSMVAPRDVLPSAPQLMPGQTTVPIQQFPASTATAQPSLPTAPVTFEQVVSGLTGLRITHGERLTPEERFKQLGAVAMMLIPGAAAELRSGGKLATTLRTAAEAESPEAMSTALRSIDMPLANMEAPAYTRGLRGLDEVRQDIAGRISDTQQRLNTLFRSRPLEQAVGDIPGSPTFADRLKVARLAVEQGRANRVAPGVQRQLDQQLRRLNEPR